MLLPICVPSFAVGFPSTAYHCRSTAVSDTAVLVQFVVVPWSEERAVLKFCRVRSAKYRLSALSVASSVSPPPAHVVYFPVSGAEAGTHLKVFPSSVDSQTQLVSEESAPGTLVYTWPEVSTRTSSSNPTPPIPLIVGCPKVTSGETACAGGPARATRIVKPAEISPR